MKRIPKTDTYDLLGKILIIGNSCVGKSSLLQRLSESTFVPNLPPTIGVEFAAVLFENTENGTRIKTQIWDCAGQSRFGSIVTSYYRQADIVVYVYDITNFESFEDLQKWYDSAEDCLGDRPHVNCVVGNKTDLSHLRAVDIELVNKFAKSIGAVQGETSAKMTSTEFEEIIGKCLKLAYDMRLSGENILHESVAQSTKPNNTVSLHPQTNSVTGKNKCSGCF